jgi:hypothetical protein
LFRRNPYNMLRTFLDLHSLVGHQTMRFAVDGLSRFLVRGFGKAEDLTGLLVESVAMVLDPVLLLDFQVLPLGVCHRLCGQPLHVPAVVHE